jgi:hypothetical protein
VTSRIATFTLFRWKGRSILFHSITIRGLSRSFRTGRLARELQKVQLSATRCSCIAILWISLVRFAAMNLCVVSVRVFIAAVVDFVADSFRKLLDIPSYNTSWSYIYVALRICNISRCVGSFSNFHSCLYSRLASKVEGSRLASRVFSAQWKCFLPFLYPVFALQMQRCPSIHLLIVNMRTKLVVHMSSLTYRHREPFR